jgi:3',5'-cyclic AMP phosphodiesterase CpdA
VALRIAHFSDVHITEDPARIPWRCLLSKRGVGWLNLRFGGRAADFAGAAPVLAAFARDVLAQSPDLVLFTGDMTGLSLPAEFERARELLEPLRRGGCAALALPGNHDLYVEEAARGAFFSQAFGEWEKSELQVADLPAGQRGLHPWPLLRRVGRELAVVAIRDARPVPLWDSSGRVGEAQLAALAQVLARPELAGRRKLLALHYGILRSDGRPDRWLHGLRDAKRLLEVAGAGGVELLLHGHIHHRYVHRRGARTPIAMANPGSLTLAGRDRAYHLYELAADGSIRLEVRRYDDRAGAFLPWPEASGDGPIVDPNPSRS